MIVSLYIQLSLSPRQHQVHLVLVVGFLFVWVGFFFSVWWLGFYCFIVAVVCFCFPYKTEVREQCSAVELTDVFEAIYSYQ